MKKRALAMIFAAFMALSMAGCGSASDTEATDTSGDPSGSAAVQTTEDSQSSNSAKLDFSGSYTDTGDGTMILSTVGGTSESGNVPAIFASKDDMLIQVSIDTEGFDGSHLSFIYIDGMFNTSEQLADSQVSIDLSGDALNVGQHTVEVVQFDTDEQDSEVITYKSTMYEIKES